MKNLTNWFFVIVVFSLAYITIVNDVNITGRVIEIPTTEELMSETDVQTPKILQTDEAKQIILSLDSVYNLKVKDLAEGSQIRLKDQENLYSISILRVHQDFANGDEFSDLLVSPGMKKFRISSKDLLYLDFNNDGEIDASIEDASFRNSQVSFYLRRP